MHSPSISVDLTSFEQLEREDDGMTKSRFLIADTVESRMKSGVCAGQDVDVEDGENGTTSRCQRLAIVSVWSCQSVCFIQISS